MKTFNNIFTFCVAVLAFTSCSQSEVSTEIIGKWKGYDIKVQNMDLSPVVISGAKQLHIHSEIIFSENKTFTENHYGESDKGMWEYDKNTKKLTFNYDKNSANNKFYAVEKCNNNELILRQDLKEFGSVQLVYRTEENE